MPKKSERFKIVNGKAKPFVKQRLPKWRKQVRERRRGLGTPLGNGLPKIDPLDWGRRREIWAYNRQKLEAEHPRIFSSSFFSRLKLIGGRSEGEVREFIPKTAFVSAKGHSWPKLVIKKFHKGARSNPENQAETMHGLSTMLLESEFNESHHFPFQIRVPEAIAFKGPFFVMRHLKGGNFIGAEEMDHETRRQVYGLAMRLGREINLIRNKLSARFESAGYHYPNTDFIPSNFILELRRKEKPVLWIIDQFHEHVSGRTPRFRRESLRRIQEKWRDWLKG